MMNFLKKIYQGFLFRVFRYFGWWRPGDPLSGYDKYFHPSQNRIRDALLGLQDSTNVVPGDGYAFPPYRAEMLNYVSKLSSVVNAKGTCCLAFPGKYDMRIVPWEVAVDIAERWNNEVENKHDK